MNGLRNLKDTQNKHLLSIKKTSFVELTFDVWRYI